jgi:serine/threonine-protein kinase
VGLRAALERTLTDRYRLDDEVGRGGMAVVYAARDLRHDRPVVIKVLRPELSVGLAAERFLREIRIAAQLQHPHILPLYDSGLLADERFSNLPYFIMPFVRGESLRTILSRSEAVSVDEALTLAREIAGALAYAHAHGIVHRDIKPENVLVSSGHAIVCDFGIARALDAAGAGGSGLTETGLLIGTPAYMSPEQALGRGDLDGRSDQYSLACVLYELLAGAPPFEGATVGAVLARRLVGRPAPVRGRRPDVPPAVAEALERSLAPDPADRFPTMSAFRDALGVPSLPGTERAPRRRGRRTLVMGAAALCFAVAAIALLDAERNGTATAAALLSSVDSAARPALSADSADGGAGTAVAVLPFAVRGGPDIRYLGTGMVDLLSTKLDGAGALRSVDPRAVLSAAGRESGTAGEIDPASGGRLAARFGAGLYVLGDVVAAGDSLQLTAALYRAGTAEPVARRTVVGASAGLFHLVDELAAGLLTDWSGGRSRVTRLAAVTTSSLPALKSYLEGETALRTGNFDGALEAFRSAGEEDTTFALAWYRMAVTAQWLTLDDVVRAAAERATRLSSRLPERDRLLLRGLRAGYLGEFEEAERIYRTILGAYPEDIEAWLQLGELTFHEGPFRGLPAAASREAWERALALEPDHLSAMVHLARLAAGAGRGAELDAWVRRIEAAHRRQGRHAEDTREEELELRILRAAALRDTAARRAALAELRGASDLTVGLASWAVVGFTDDLPTAEAIARLLTEHTRAPMTRAVGFGHLAFLEAGRGRWSSAWRALAAMEPLDRDLWAEFGGILAAVPFSPATPADMQRLRQALDAPPAAAGAAPRFGANSVIHSPVRYRPQVREYIAGLLDARLGDEAAALRRAALIERSTDSSASGTVTQSLAHGLRAEAARAGGRPAEVLAHLDSLKPGESYLVTGNSPALAMGRERWLRAETLRRLGRGDEALRWYGSFAEWSIYDAVYRAPGASRRAAIFERAGRAREAAAERARAGALWRDAETAYRKPPAPGP